MNAYTHTLSLSLSVSLFLSLSLSLSLSHRTHGPQPVLNVRPLGGSASKTLRLEDAEQVLPDDVVPGARARTPLEWARVSDDEAMVAALTGRGEAGGGGGEGQGEEEEEGAGKGRMEGVGGVEGRSEEDSTHESEVLMGRLKRGKRRNVEELVTKFAHRAVIDNVKAHQVPESMVFVCVCVCVCARARARACDRVRTSESPYN